MTIPNILTVLRCCGVLALAVLLAWPWGPERGAALAVFVLAAATDWLDGKLARALDQTTAFGRMLDQIADKLLVAVTLLMLCAAGTVTGVHALAAALILVREIAISGMREHLASREIVVPSSLLGKWKTTVQLLALGVLLAAPLTPVPGAAQVSGLVLLWVAALLTVVSGAQYVQGVIAAPAGEERT